MTSAALRQLASAMSPAHRAAVLAQMQPDAPKVRRGMNKTEAALGIVAVSIPIRTVSEMNVRQHWAARAARAKRQRATTMLYVSRLPRLQMPVTVLLVRTGGKRLDDDNLRSALKSARDGVADAYGIDDGSPLWEWRCGQKPGKGPLGVRVEIQRLHAHEDVEGELG